MVHAVNASQASRQAFPPPERTHLVRHPAWAGWPKTLPSTLACGLATLGLLTANLAVFADPGEAVSVTPTMPAAQQNRGEAPAASVRARVSSHRGGLEWAAPQSLEAFGASLHAGFNTLEFDVRFSSDLVAVISHDEKPACAPHGIQTRSAGELESCGVVRLSEVLSLAQSSSNARLLPELKTQTGQSVASQQKQARTLAAAVKNAGLSSRTTIASFRFDVVLPAVQGTDQQIRRQALVVAPEPRSVLAAKQAGANEYSYDASSGGTAWLNTFVKRHKMSPVTWWMREAKPLPKDYAAQHALGASSIITNFPAAAAKQISAQRCVSTWVNVRDFTVFEGTLRPGQRVYPHLLKAGFPSQKNAQSVLLKVIPASKKTKAGTVHVAPKNSSLTHDASLARMKGKSSYRAWAVGGDDGDLRVFATGSQPLKIRIVLKGYMAPACK